MELEGAARRRVKGYSLGMRQRLGLAAALLGDPELLILDEPANGLDPEGVRWLRNYLRSLASEGRTVLVSSHVLAEVAQTVDQVLIMSRGRLRRRVPLAELTARAGGAVRVRSADPQQLAPALRGENLQVKNDIDHTPARERAHRATGSVRSPSPPAFQFMSWATDGGSLEDIFLQTDPR